MRVLLSIIWHIPFVGFLFAIGYALWGFVLCCTVILYPVGLGYLHLAKFLMAPFSQRMVSRADYNALKGEEHSIFLEGYETLIRVLYFPFGVVAWIYTIAVIVSLFVTIAGIPAALVWARSLGTIYNPINKVVVSVEEAEQIEIMNGNFYRANG